jgi:predicted permease
MMRSRQMLDGLDQDIRQHIDDETQDNIARGMSPEEARYAALRKFGNVTRVKEEARGVWIKIWLEQLLQDIRFGLRTLRKSPGFTAVAVLTLALGIGANTAIFTLVKTTLLQPLPIKSSNRLVVIWINNLKQGWSRIGPAGQDYLDWREQAKSFDDLFLFEHGTGTVTGAGDPEQVAGLRVTTNFGEFFGIKPVLGRTFHADEQAAPHNLAILSYHYWQESFGASSDVIGRGMILNGVPYTIIGVLPTEVSTVFPIDVVVPFDNAWVKRADSDLGVFGRLKQGVTLKQASAEMSVIMQRMALERPSRKEYGAVLVPLESVRVEYIRPALLVLLGAVGFVLLIACANVANLLLSRAMGRQKEVAVRIALGAGRARLAQQFLTESFLLAFLGGCVGMLLALWSSYLLAKYTPTRIFVPNAADQVALPTVHLDSSAFVFTFIISMMAGLIFGMIPAFQSLRCKLYEWLKSGERGFGAGRRGGRSKSALVIIEGALAFVLVIGAGLMMKSFSHLLATDPGFQANHLLTLRIKLANDVKDSKYKDAHQQIAAFHNFLKAVEVLPGVQSAAVAEIIPMSQEDMDMGFFVIKERAPLPPGEHMSADFRDVSTNYFRTMGIPLIQGRAFTDRDTVENPRVVIIDETFARSFFPNENPIGRHLQIPNASAVQREIVGVVGGVHDTGFDQKPRATIYFPALQASDQAMTMVVRTALPTATILPAIKNAIWSVDRDQPVFNVRTMDDIISEITSAERIATLALDVFAFLALALAAIGIYGVTSYAVGQRTREIGIRLALGAQKDDVMRMVLGQGVRLALWSVAFGSIASLALTRLMVGLLFGISASDPFTFVAVAILMVSVGMLACYVPARRAMRVDPIVALRYE